MGSRKENVNPESKNQLYNLLSAHDEKYFQKLIVI